MLTTRRRHRSRTVRARIWAMILLLIGSVGVAPDAMAIGTTGSDEATHGADTMDIPATLPGDFDTSDIAAATAWADKLNLADWLGPLAPLALSPFFGVACLSGFALWGPEWITDNALLNSASPLCSVPMFLAFAMLTVLTSVPRLTKVSKPFAQSVDRLEAYAVIVILLVIKVMSSFATGPTETTPTGEWTAMSMGIVAQAGIFSFTADTLLMIAMAINILVINAVKFFFEFLVWLTPFPTVDAIFEICNKTLSAALLAIYAASPMLATVLNLLILGVALILFRWIGRRVQFYRTMLLDPVLSRLWPAYRKPSPRGLLAFCKDAAGPFPTRSCLRLQRHGDAAVLVASSRWSPLHWGHSQQVLNIERPPKGLLKRGWLSHTLTLTGRSAESDAPDGGDNDAVSVTLTISRRHDAYLDALVQIHDLELQQAGDDPAPADRTSTAKLELA